MGNDFSDYVKEGVKIQSNVCVIHAEPGALYGINLPEEIVSGIQAVYLDVWKIAMKNVEYYNPNLVKFLPHKFIMCQGDNAKNSVRAKQMFCRFHKLFCTLGWSLTNSPSLTFRFSLSSWFYYKEINPYLIDTGAMDNEFCAISLSGFDSLQFIDFPEQLESGIINCMKDTWHKGIKDRESIEDTDKAWSIQMNGHPWSSYGEESLDARYLVLALIRFMSHRNWRLINSTAMKPDACDTMFFRNFSTAFNFSCPDTMPEYYFMLALMGSNYLAVLGVNENIKTAIASSCAKHEKNGVKSVEIKNKYPVIIMNSNVWSRVNTHEIYTKRLMTLLFQDLAAIGWLPVESIDCSRSIRDLSSIAFVSIPPLRMMFFCLFPKKYNGINLVNAPDDVTKLIFDTFVQCYPIKKEKVTMDSCEISSTIHFRGDPFTGTNTFGVLLFQQTLAMVICALKNVGWNLILSADTLNETRNTGSQSNNQVNFSIYGLWFGKMLLQ